MSVPHDPTPPNDPAPMSKSPLDEAAPDSLEALWARIDGHVTRRSFESPEGQFDLERMIAELRRQREIFERAEAAGTKPRKARKQAPTETTAEDLIKAMRAQTGGESNA